MPSDRARDLRKNPTEAEKLLWSRLRLRQIGGVRFRRQVPIGPYVVDFASHEAKLIIEVDGGQHASNQEMDGRRTRWLESEGYRVIRFWNNEVLANTEAVLHSIDDCLSSAS
ncbi:MAG: endonuclease domain-containing protein [Alphaproteobacteria bacterium]|nr:endonuclease domain-containing protein [Alphaproteobacteria bacterium]